LQLEARQKGMKIQETSGNLDDYQNRRHIVPAGPTVYFQKVGSFLTPYE
jgi:hypothetical protein